MDKSPWLELLHAALFETSGSSADFSLCIGIGSMKGFLVTKTSCRQIQAGPDGFLTFAPTLGEAIAGATRGDGRQNLGQLLGVRLVLLFDIWLGQQFFAKSQPVVRAPQPRLGFRFSDSADVKSSAWRKRHAKPAADLVSERTVGVLECSIANPQTAIQSGLAKCFAGGLRVARSAYVDAKKHGQPQNIAFTEYEATLNVKWGLAPQTEVASASWRFFMVEDQGTHALCKDVLLRNLLVSLPDAKQIFLSEVSTMALLAFIVSGGMQNELLGRCVEKLYILFSTHASTLRQLNCYASVALHLVRCYSNNLVDNGWFSQIQTGCDSQCFCNARFVLDMLSSETMPDLHYYDRSKSVIGDFWCQIGDLGPDFQRSKVQAVIDISTTKPLTPYELFRACRRDVELQELQFLKVKLLEKEAEFNALKSEHDRLAEMLDAHEPAKPLDAVEPAAKKGKMLDAGKPAEPLDAGKPSEPIDAGEPAAQKAKLAS